MGLLENIPKKDFFRVPEYYFDNLPMEIQRRTEAKQGREIKQVFRYARYAVPVLLITILLVYSNTRKPDPESILSSVETIALIQYLEECDVTTEELLKNADFSPREAEAFEMAVFKLEFQNDGEQLPNR